ncbi:MAG: helix-turn-helix transcriptional regulator [Clostridia bacterium]|nr:helix-turn-helix transcriptional regulator [Clostridia bacterium]
MDYIDRLISVRIDKDLTQKEVANVISKSQQGYDHIEKRRAKLTIEDFIKLCDFYNINPLYFLGYENNIYPLK